MNIVTHAAFGGPDESDVTPINSKIHDNTFNGHRSLIYVGHDPRPYTTEELAVAPFPVDYYLRKPRPHFEYDYAPWRIQQFSEEGDQSVFLDALERHGFMVDREGWLRE